MPDDAPDRDTNRCLDCEALLLAEPQSYVADLGSNALLDGQQALILTWPDGKVTVALRPDRWATWGPAVQAFRK